METDHVTIHHRALIAMDKLPSAERKALFKALKGLSVLPPAQWPQQGLRLLKPEEGLYSFRVTPDLIVFFSVIGPNQLRIDDLVRPETLELYFGPRSKSGKPA
jgi:hypothetical protein